MVLGVFGVRDVDTPVPLLPSRARVMSVDATDRRIVDLLCTNGRLSYAELARQVGLSGPAVHERVGKLEASGVIRAYRADIDPDAVGRGVTAFIGIVQAADSEVDDIVAAMSELSDVESCYFLAGAES